MQISTWAFRGHSDELRYRHADDHGVIVQEVSLGLEFTPYSEVEAEKVSFLYSLLAGEGPANITFTVEADRIKASVTAPRAEKDQLPVILPRDTYTFHPRTDTEKVLFALIYAGSYYLLSIEPFITDGKARLSLSVPYRQQQVFCRADFGPQVAAPAPTRMTRVCEEIARRLPWRRP